jgi:hypothetical protein
MILEQVRQASRRTRWQQRSYSVSSPETVADRNTQ